MGKAERNRHEGARAKIAAQQAAARQDQARNRALIVGGAVVAVLAIVVALISFKLLAKSSAAPVPGGSASAAAGVSRQIASVPAAAFDKVAAGPSSLTQGGVYPKAVQTIKPAGALLTSAGKPQVVYVGAEYCPYCAAERWALAVALSRFGTFSGLRLIHSAPAPESYPSTATLSFYKSTYTSKYLTFTSTEAQTVTHTTLQPMTALDTTLMTKFDAPPYVPAGYNGSFPFVDFGSRYVIAGASYDPGLLANLTWQQIGADLASPSGTAGTAIVGAANHITAAICKITNNQPSNVCTSAGVTSVSGSI